LFQPLTYGNPWTKAQCKRVTILSGWDWDCNNLFDTFEQYASFDSSSLVSNAAQPTGLETNKDKSSKERQIEARGASPPMDDKTNVVVYEQHIEYHDEDGNVLNDEQVKALQGQVEFKTVYETTTRLLDQDGNLLPEGYVVDGLNEEGEEKLVEPEPIPGVNEETPKGQVQKRDEQIEVEGTLSDEHDEHHDANKSIFTKWVNVEETEVVVVDEAGNVLSTQMGTYQPEPVIHTEIVYVAAEPEMETHRPETVVHTEVVYVAAEPEVHTVVVEDGVVVKETVTVEVSATETVTVVVEEE